MSRWGNWWLLLRRDVATLTAILETRRWLSLSGQITVSQATRRLCNWIEPDMLLESPASGLLSCLRSDERDIIRSGRVASVGRLSDDHIVMVAS